MNEKVVLIGAGSAMFTKGLVTDILRKKWTGEVALVDIDPAALAVAEGLARKLIAAAESDIRLSAHTDRRNALPGATAVICTIGVGGRRAWEQDVLIPRKYGIFQPVGDTIMPGGSSRALRMIDAMVAIARDILDLAPDALFFNYANPMSAICRSVRKATGANIVGLCHGVMYVEHLLCDWLQVPRQNFKSVAVGINHLTWFTDIRENGRDLMPRLREIAAEKVNRVPDVADPFTWQLVDLLGAFPAVLDRHVCEFFPHMFKGEKAYYGKTLGIDVFNFEECIAWGDDSFAEMEKIALSPEPLPGNFFRRTSGDHEQVTDIIESIRLDKGDPYSANLPNAGQVPNLPWDAVVESPAIAGAAGVLPIMQKPLAPALAGFLASKFLWAETIIEAALEGSRGKFIQALLLDGSVSSVDEARRLADDLLAAQAAYLLRFKR